jgi:hypothetical protein
MQIDANVIEGSLYATENNGFIELTVTSRGNLAFNDYPANLEGNGFKYKGSENLMFEGAFMYGTDPFKVMDGARIKDQQANDFVHIKMIDDGKSIYSFFSDPGAGPNALGIKILLETILPGGNNFVILKCELINSSSQNIDSLYVGYYIDWDIPESGYDQDTTYFDNTNKFAVAYNVKDSTKPFTGMALISDENFGYYAIDNVATSGNVVLNDENGFSDAEKWYALSNGVANSPGKVGNISFVLSGGPYNIPAGKHLFVTFSIAAAPTLQEVVDAIKQSREKYGGEIENGQEPLVFQLNQNYPNPFNSSTVISYRLAADRMVTLKVYDILGRNVATLINEFQSAGDHQVQLSTFNYQLSSGVYFYRIDTGDFSKARKLILLK